MRKNIIVFSLILTIIAILYQKCKNDTKYERQFNSVNDSLLIYTNKSGKLATQANDLQITIQELRESKDSLLNELKKENKAKELISATRVRINSTGQIKTVFRDTVIKQTDTVIVYKSFYWKDNWLELSGLSHDDSIEVRYNLTNDLLITHSWKKKQAVVTVTSNNPYTTVNKLVSYSIKPKPKRFYETRAFAIALTAIGTAILLK